MRRAGRHDSPSMLIRARYRIPSQELCPEQTLCIMNSHICTRGASWRSAALSRLNPFNWRHEAGAGNRHGMGADQSLEGGDGEERWRRRRQRRLCWRNSPPEIDVGPVLKWPGPALYRRCSGQGGGKNPGLTTRQIKVTEPGVRLL